MKTMSLFFLFTVCGISAIAAVNSEPPIVPAVQQWQGATGHLDIRNAPVVLASKDEKLLRPTAELLRCDLAGRSEIIIADRPVGKPAIRLVLSDIPFKAGTNVIEEQSYTVDITGKGVTVTGHNRAGIFFGTRSILQMLEAERTLPCGRIVDGPVTRYRLLMLDVGRKAFPMAALYDYLRILGWYKMNGLHLHLSDSSFDNHYGGFRVSATRFRASRRRIASTASSNCATSGPSGGDGHHGAARDRHARARGGFCHVLARTRLAAQPVQRHAGCQQSEDRRADEAGA